ncbi:uncharacterized protein B0J16DRAFT_170459 [Fusarium flagelliforme]|uniref:uncharacterized protein n=1 Tax=Fusarium flagelliforme TaxID=2675880 RepID=UPI001E8CE19F|nr:uncharacterized protein B0J16DRAFT_170459 [Fusarium flagelliforme]KAH7179412.1 hypothetical protein B0J16DRAFT_170459 [Fusarium flagelliforme]
MAGYNDRSDPNQNNWEDYINYTPDDVIDPGLRDPVDPAQVDASFPTYTNPPSSQPPASQVQNPSLEPAFDPGFSHFPNLPTNPTQNQYLPTPRNSVPVTWYSDATQGNPASTAGYNSGYTIPPSSNHVPTPSHPVNAPNYHDSTSAIHLAPTRGGQLAFPMPVNHGPPSTNTSPAATGSAFTGSSPAVYPNPNDVSSQTPGTTPGDSEPATTQGRKRQRETSPSTEQPRRTRRKTPNLSGSVVYNDSPADDSEPNAATSVSGRNRSRATTQPRNKANDSGTSTPASRKKPGKKSLGINVRHSRMKELSEPDQSNQLYPKATHTKKSKGKGKGEEANGETDSKKTRGGNKIIEVRTECDFCANHPDGRAAFNVNGKCDWEHIASGGGEVFNRECGNCANYRSRNRQIGEMASKDDHMCRVQDDGALVDFNHKKYGDFDPYNYQKSTCDRCQKHNLEDVCDIDTVLGYGCSHCRRDQDCKVDGNLMPLRRPKKLKGRPWYRHACNRCQARHEKYKDLEENVPCNWLTDRSLWDQQRQACSVCYRDCAPCIDDKHNIIPPLPSAPPRQARAPTTWTTRKRFEVEEKEKKKDRKTPWHEYVEVATDTKWRKKCFGCQGAGRSVQCLVMWDQANYACERCTQFGVDCVFHDVITETWTRYPIYDLSRVGFGQFTPYVVCTPCKKNGRRCDRRRPCDSCTFADTECDRINQSNARGLIAREMIAPHKSRDPIPIPGPLYYLALGYGPDGINDIKDGQRIEHWIGPIAPVYGVEKLQDSGELYRAVADLHQIHRPPEGVAPPTISTPLYTSEGEWDKLEDVQSNALTVEHLASLIRQLWENCKVPWNYEQAYRELWGTLREAQEDIMRGAGEDVQLSDAPAILRAFRGNPILADLENFHNGFLGVSPQARPLPELPPGSHTVEPSQVDQIPDAAPAPLPVVPYGGGYSDSVYPPASAQQGESIVASGGGVDHSQVDQAPDATSAPSLGFTADGGYPENMFYSYSDEQEENDVTSRARDQQGGDNQQSQQTQPSDQSQPDVDPPGFTAEQMARLLGLDEGKYRGRFMTGQYSPRTSRAGRRPIRKARPFANRVPRDTKAKDKTFNPFLSFALDENRNPRLKARERNSRWKVFNPLEGLDMEKWQNSNSQPDEDTSQPRLFSVVNGQRNQSVLRADVLDDVPYEQIGGRSQQSCAEPGEGGIGRCGHQNVNGQDQAVCQSSAHRDTAPGSFPVCNDCVQANVKDMFRHDCNPIIESELLSMRAYLCNDCAGHMSSSVKNAAEYRAIGARRVFGLEADEEISHSTYTPNNDRSQAVEFHKDTEALTGCSCANKLFGTSMCRFHRLYYAEEALKFSALVQEWRLSKFKKAVCPSCLAKKPLDKANLSADVGGFANGAPTAWACVNCNDWVANEKNNKTNQPSLIDKKLWSSKDGRELFALRQESAHSRVPEIDDADMGEL